MTHVRTIYVKVRYRLTVSIGGSVFGKYILLRKRDLRTRLLFSRQERTYTYRLHILDCEPTYQMRTANANYFVRCCQVTSPLLMTKGFPLTVREHDDGEQRGSRTATVDAPIVSSSLLDPIRLKHKRNASRVRISTTCLLDNTYPYKSSKS